MATPNDNDELYIAISHDRLHSLIALLRERRDSHDEIIAQAGALGFAANERRTWLNAREDLQAIMDACLTALRAHLRKQKR